MRIVPQRETYDCAIAAAATAAGVSYEKARRVWNAMKGKSRWRESKWKLSVPQMGELLKALTGKRWLTKRYQRKGNQMKDWRLGEGVLAVCLVWVDSSRVGHYVVAEGREGEVWVSDPARRKDGKRRRTQKASEVWFARRWVRSASVRQADPAPEDRQED